MSNALVREIFLAIGLVVLLLGSMFISTGTFPPMVVVESGSMMHDDEVTNNILGLRATI